MESVNYLRGLVRSWWLILLVLVAGGAGGYVVYSRETPLYQSTVGMIVASRAPKADEVSARQLTMLRAQALAQIAGTAPAAQDAITKAGLAGRAAGVTVSAVSSDSFVSVTVSGPDPAVAQALAAAFPSTLPGSLVRLAGTSGTPFALNTLSLPVRAADPYAPDGKSEIGLGLAAGLVLGLALAVLRETLDRTVRDTDELQRLLDLTVLGTVPRDLPKELLPASTHPRSARAEAYRQVRTTLLNLSTRRPLVIAVTSATLGEGKTSVAANVAVVFSRAGHRVALVDADLRRPRVAAFFGLSEAHGLTDVLTGEMALEDALVMQDDRLAVLPSGRIPSNPSEALGSAAMEAVLRDLAAAFEFVIIDTPPVLPVTDALVIAPEVDGVVFVARLGRTTRERIRRAKSTVERVNATILGVVPNQAGKGADADYQYPYRYSAAKRGEVVEETSVPEDGLRETERPTGAHAARDDGPVGMSSVTPPHEQA